MKDRYTTIFGAMAGMSALLASMGINFGHIGKVTGMQAISAFALTALGFKAADKTSGG